MPTVRLATLDDASELFALTRDFSTSFVVERMAFDRSLAALALDPNAHLAVAEDGVLVGYVLGFDHYALFASGRVSWVEEIIVQEGRRRQNVGRQLMDSFEAWCRARGSRMVALATRRAAGFYEAIGYERSAEYFRKLL